MHIAKTVFRLLAAGFAAFSLLLLVAVGIGPRTGRYQTITVLTGSMRPTMPEGSLLVTTPVPARAVGVGDVITYRVPVEDRRVVTHRVVEVVRPGDEPVVRTKGDANKDPDAWVATLQGGTVWQARADIPKLGYALEWLRQPQAQKLLVLGMPLSAMAVLLRDIWRRPAAPPAARSVRRNRPPAVDSSSQNAVRGVVALVALLSLGAASRARSG